MEIGTYLVFLGIALGLAAIFGGRIKVSEFAFDNFEKKYQAIAVVISLISLSTGIYLKLISNGYLDDPLKNHEVKIFVLSKLNENQWTEEIEISVSGDYSGTIFVNNAQRETKVPIDVRHGENSYSLEGILTLKEGGEIYRLSGEGTINAADNYEYFVVLRELDHKEKTGFLYLERNTKGVVTIKEELEGRILIDTKKVEWIMSDNKKNITLDYDFWLLNRSDYYIECRVDISVVLVQNQEVIEILVSDEYEASLEPKKKLQFSDLLEAPKRANRSEGIFQKARPTTRCTVYHEYEPVDLVIKG